MLKRCDQIRRSITSSIFPRFFVLLASRRSRRSLARIANAHPYGTAAPHSRQFPPSGRLSQDQLRRTLRDRQDLDADRFADCTRAGVAGTRKPARRLAFLIIAELSPYLLAELLGLVREYALVRSSHKRLSRHKRFPPYGLFPFYSTSACALPFFTSAKNSRASNSAKR